MSFPWIFALIVGAFILFLAIYGVSKLIGTQETLQSAKTSKEIGILLNPLETGFEEAKSSTLFFPVETRVYTDCNLGGDFGRQLIRISQKSFNKWVDTDLNVGFSNKYIFSKNPSEGEEFFIFVKPFDFPFKVSDLTYITSSRDVYCFVNAPDDIEEEIGNLQQENLLIENCSELKSNDVRNVTKVCFGQARESGCAVQVDYGNKMVETRDGKVHFETDALLYGAIFAEKNIYECQVRRLMQRVESLARLYSQKINMVGCGTNMQTDLIMLINSAKGVSDSSDLTLVNFVAEDIDSKNKAAGLCKLW